MINDKMRAGMAEATRLTRAGQLAEATALIQRTLRDVLAPEAASETGGRAPDEPIDITSRAVEVSTSGPERRTGTPAVIALPPPEVAVSLDGSSGASSTIRPGRGNERVEPVPAAPGRFARLRARLRPGRSGLGEPIAEPIPDRVPGESGAGGRFTHGSYTNQAGTRTYKLYIPSGYHGQALPLVVMLHGCTQTSDDFAAGTRMNELAEKELFFVAYPAQATPANQSRCWNWFKETDQYRDQGEPSIIAGITRQILNRHSIDPRRVYVAGLSAGAAMAMIMGMSYPDLYAAVGVHSGLPYGAAHDIPSAFAAMRGGADALRQGDSRLPAGAHTRFVPAIVFHGDRDTTVHPCNGDQVLTQWAALHTGDGPAAGAGEKLHVTLHPGQISDGHAYTRAIYHDAHGHAVMERWLVHGAGHAWSGGSLDGSFTDPRGPDASQEMVRFFYEHSRSEP